MWLLYPLFAECRLLRLSRISRDNRFLAPPVKRDVACLTSLISVCTYVEKRQSAPTFGVPLSLYSRLGAESWWCVLDTESTHHHDSLSLRLSQCQMVAKRSVFNCRQLHQLPHMTAARSQSIEYRPLSPFDVALLHAPSSHTRGT